MSQILAIDYGKVRTGLAITDSLQIIASTLETVRTQELMGFLKDFISLHKIDVLVIGLPVSLNNQMNEIERDILLFIKELALIFPSLKIERIDERFTSKLATESILYSGVSKKNRRNKALVDQVSATIILQSYLNSKS